MLLQFKWEEVPWWKKADCLTFSIVNEIMIEAIHCQLFVLFGRPKTTAQLIPSVSRFSKPNHNFYASHSLVQFQTVDAKILLEYLKHLKFYFRTMKQHSKAKLKQL